MPSWFFFFSHGHGCHWWLSPYITGFSSFHRVFGKGLVADVVLWMNWRGAVAVLIYATALWYLFERVGYNFLSFVIQVFCQQTLMLALDSWKPSKLIEDFLKFLFWSMYFRHVSLYFLFSIFFSFFFYLSSLMLMYCILQATSVFNIFQLVEGIRHKINLVSY